MYSNLGSKILCPHYKLHLMMQIIFQKLIIRWQPYPSWKQRTWSSHWCSALRALLFGLILAEMDALSALAGKDFYRSSCTEPICRHSPKWGWQLCVPGAPDLAEAALLRLSRVLGEARPPPVRPAPMLCSAERSPGWEPSWRAQATREQLRGAHGAHSPLALGISQAQLNLSARAVQMRIKPWCCLKAPSQQAPQPDSINRYRRHWIEFPPTALSSSSS